MDRDLAIYAVDKAQELGARYAEVRLEHSSNNGIILKNGIPQISGFEEHSGLGMRILVNDRLGFFATNKLDNSSILSQIKILVDQLSKAKDMQNPIKLSDIETSEANYEVKESKKLEDVDPSERVDLLKDIDNAIQDTKVNVPGRYLSYSDALVEKHIVTSEGTRIFSRIPYINYLYYITVALDNKSVQRYWQYGETGGWERVLEAGFKEKSVKEVKAMHGNLKTGKLAPTGKLDIVVGPEVTGIMVHEAVGHPLEADRILGREAAQAGESFVKRDMLGTRIGSDAVNVYEDPTIPGSFGYYLYDDEGVKARRRELVKKGIFAEFLNNRDTARQLSVQSNGSSRADSYVHEPIIRMSNTFFGQGDQTEEELIEGIKHGIYMRNFTEWNIDDVRLNQKYVGCDSYLIENGKITRPVVAPTIEISTPDLWSSVDAAGKNLEYHAGTCGKGEPMQGIPVWLGGPSIRLRNIKLSHKNGA